MKIAWLTPFRRNGSGIALVSAAACGGLLADGHEVVVFAPDLRDPRLAARADLPVVGPEEFGRAELLSRLRGFDLVVYHLGDNAEYHREIYEISRQHPGVVVLHDLVMRDFFEGYFMRDRGGGRPGVLRLMEFCHGPDGAAWMEAVMDGRIADIWTDPHMLDYHMARAAVAGALGVVVHSEFSRARVARCADAPVTGLAFPIPEIAEEALAWGPPPAGPGRPVRLLTYGFINRNKLVDLVIECLGASPMLRRRVVYTVVGAVGDPRYRAHLDQLVARLGLAKSVRFVGPKYGADLHEEIRAADVVVNLRNPQLGESSWSLMEALFGARPTIVWDHGSYAEFPDRAVRKVASREGFAAALEGLCTDDARRRALGEEGRRHARETFDSRRYGRGIVAFAEELRAQRPVLDLADRAGRFLREMTDGPGAQHALDRIAEEIDRLADDDPAASAPRRRVATGAPAARADHAA